MEEQQRLAVGSAAQVGTAGAAQPALLGVHEHLPLRPRPVGELHGATEGGLVAALAELALGGDQHVLPPAARHRRVLDHAAAAHQLGAARLALRAAAARQLDQADRGRRALGAVEQVLVPAPVLEEVGVDDAALGHVAVAPLDLVVRRRGGRLPGADQRLLVRDEGPGRVGGRGDADAAPVQAEAGHLGGEVEQPQAVDLDQVGGPVAAADRPAGLHRQGGRDVLPRSARLTGPARGARRARSRPRPSRRRTAPPSGRRHRGRTAPAGRPGPGRCTT